MLYSDSALDELEKITPEVAAALASGDKEAVNAATREYYYSMLTPEQQLLLPRIRSAKLEDARYYHINAKNSKASLQSEKGQRKTEIEERLSALDAQISSAYGAFNIVEDKKS